GGGRRGPVELRRGRLHQPAAGLVGASAGVRRRRVAGAGGAGQRPAGLRPRCPGGRPALVAGSPEPAGRPMIGLCLGLAGVLWAEVPTDEFTLAWTHTIEKIRWEEDYQLPPAGLRLQAARVRGTGAGMEVPDGAVLRDGAWHYQPQLPALPR